ncbi:MAG: hypothetical protein GY788_13200 [bacterium]|nr:hypothetical protein [bacterium]
MTGIRDGGNGEERPAVRIGSGGGDEMWEASPEKGPPRRWIGLVLGVVAALAGVTVIVTLGDGDAPSVSTTIAAPLLSEPGPVTVDATGSYERESGGDWALAELGLTGGLGDVVATDAGFVAVGHDSEGLGLWRSGTGEFWEPSLRLEVPSGTDLSYLSTPWGVSRLQLLEWEGSTVVFGPVGDGLAVWLDGGLRGVMDEFPAGSHPRVVAGDQLLAVVLSAPDGVEVPEIDQFEESWLLSDDGVEWVSISPSGLPEAGVSLIGWVGGFYYVSASCAFDDCAPLSLYRSSDGATWETTDVEVPGAPHSGVGQIIDIARVGERLLAVGAVDRGAGFETAMWSSSSGQHWDLILLPDAFRSDVPTVELIGTNSTDEAIAIVSIDGVQFELPIESVIDTDAGRIVVTAIGSDSIIVSIGNQGSRRLDQGVPLALQPTPLLNGIVADGPRVAIGGLLGTSDDGGDSFSSLVPAVWLSEDSGATWEVSIIDEPDGVFVDSMAITSGSISMISYSNTGSTLAWHNQRDTTASR